MESLESLKKREKREIGGDAAYIGTEIDSEALRSFFCLVLPKLKVLFLAIALVSRFCLL